MVRRVADASATHPPLSDGVFLSSELHHPFGMSPGTSVAEFQPGIDKVGDCLPRARRFGELPRGPSGPLDPNLGSSQFELGYGFLPSPSNASNEALPREGCVYRHAPSQKSAAPPDTDSV